MNEAATKASARTTLAFGTVRAPVALFKATGDPPDLPAFERAGPNGGPLVTRIKNPPETPTRPVPDPAAPKPDALGIEVRGNDTTIVMPTTVIVEETTGIEVEEPRRGIRLDDGEFVDLTDDLVAIEEFTKLDEMEIVGTVSAGDVQRHQVKASYFLGTDGEGAMTVLGYLYAGLRRANRVAIAKATKKTRQSLFAIAPYDLGEWKVLRALELSWAAELRPPPTRAQLVAELTADGVDAATELVRALGRGPSVVSEAEDVAVVLRRELIEAARSGRKFGRPGRVENLREGSIEDALARSVGS